MKNIICFITLFTISHCTDYRGTDWREYVNTNIYQYYGKYNGYNDRSSYNNSIIYPCAVHDTHCIRRVFAQNSQCTPVEGPTPDPYILKRISEDVPHANATVILFDSPIKGLHNWRIQEFFVNKTSDRLVFEVVFDKLVVSSPNAVFRIYRRGREPVEVSDFAIIEYNNVSLTLIIPHIRHIQLSRGHVYAYIPDPFPRLALGPGILSSKDPDVIASLAVLTGNLGLSVRELFVQRGPTIMSVFLESTICNFGYY